MPDTITGEQRPKPIPPRSRTDDLRADVVSLQDREREAAFDPSEAARLNCNHTFVYGGLTHPSYCTSCGRLLAECSEEMLTRARRAVADAAEPYREIPTCHCSTCRTTRADRAEGFVDDGGMVEL